MGSPKRHTPAEVDEFIRARFEAGTRPSDIGNAIGEPASFIHARLDAMGVAYDEPGHEPRYHVHPMWDASADERRESIWKRQRDGASAALGRRVRS